ncbi:hypothetical protein [Hymenobacter sp. AT01-02]|uniref:hypothetical protein n=1 Tax=Hymenobacter sp. AT01-02 TaxID=1571877 RepID=UPI00128F6929|nr:hypothetical protein [Hymenobacter sp. AT01-02]
MLALSQIVYTEFTDAPQEGTFGYSTLLGHWHERHGKDAVANLTIHLLDGTKVNVPFDTVEKRHETFTTLHGELGRGLDVIFPNLALETSKLEAVFFSWQKGEWMSHKLLASIKIEGAEPYIIGVTSDLMEQAEALASLVGVTIPPAPKSAADYAAELDALPGRGKQPWQ